MGFTIIWGCLKALKIMNNQQRKLFFDNKGSIIFDTYKSGYPNFTNPIGFIQEKGDLKTKEE